MSWLWTWVWPAKKSNWIELAALHGKRAGKVTPIIIVGLIAIEHLGRVRQWNTAYLPSTVLTSTYKNVQEGFKRIGSSFAVLSSYLIHLRDYLKLAELLDSTVAVVNPIVKLIASPVKVLTGYAETMRDRYGKQHPMLVVIGSGLLVGGPIALYKYRHLLKK